MLTSPRVQSARGRALAQLCKIAPCSSTCLSGTRPPLDLLKRKEAVGGLVNLLRNRKVHLNLVNEGLLPVLLRLSKSGVQAEAVAGKMIGAGGLGHALKRTGSGPGIPKP